MTQLARSGRIQRANVAGSGRIQRARGQSESTACRMRSTIRSLEERLEQLTAELHKTEQEAHEAAAEADDRLHGQHLCLQAAVHGICQKSLGRCALLSSLLCSRALTH